MVVASSVLAVLHVVVAVVHLLGDAAREITLALLGHDILDESLLGLVVVGHLPRLILAAVVLKHRVALQLASSVGHAHGIDFVLVHVHVELLGSELHIAIVDCAGTKHVGIVLPVHHDRVLGREVDSMVKVDLGLLEACSVGRDRCLFVGRFHAGNRVDCCCDAALVVQGRSLTARLALRLMLRSCLAKAQHSYRCHDEKCG